MKPLAVAAISAAAFGFIILTILLGGPQRTNPALGPIFSTASAGIARPIVTSRAEPDTTTRPSDLAPTPPLTGVASPSVNGTASPMPTETFVTAPVALRTDTIVVDAWRDALGTARVHVVIAATNDTGEIRTVATGERAFSLIGPAGEILHTGQFSQAFPSIMPPDSTSYLITTVVLPSGADETNLRVEANIEAAVTTAVEPMLEVSDLELISTDDRPGVRGTVLNTGATDITSGVAAVLGSNAAGEVLAAWYDTIMVSSIPAGGQAPFLTEYPGVPPSVAEEIVDLRGVAFDAGSRAP